MKLLISIESKELRRHLELPGQEVRVEGSRQRAQHVQKQESLTVNGKFEKRKSPQWSESRVYVEC